MENRVDECFKGGARGVAEGYRGWSMKIHS
jgi:hypothetical protein